MNECNYESTYVKIALSDGENGAVHAAQKNDAITGLMTFARKHRSLVVVPNDLYLHLY